MQKKVLKNKNWNNWLRRQNNDVFVKDAKKFGYKSRAAFKLLDIQKKFNILKKTDCVLDLGAAPGSWSQVAAQIVSNCSKHNARKSNVHNNSNTHNNRSFKNNQTPDNQCHDKSLSNIVSESKNNCQYNNVVALDILKMNPILGVDFLHKDCREIIASKNLNLPVFNTILSDMLSNTTGHSDIDHQKSIDLCLIVAQIANIYLKLHGNVVMKILQGKNFCLFVQNLKKSFEKVSLYKPLSSRKASKEIYIVALNKICAIDTALL